jgi:hypothetical protein
MGGGQMTVKHPLRAIPRTSYPRPVIKGEEVKT